jgi:hypothetical protein
VTRASRYLRTQAIEEPGQLRGDGLEAGSLVIVGAVALDVVRRRGTTR